MSRSATHQRQRPVSLARKAARRPYLRYLVGVVAAFVLASSGVAYAYFSTPGGGTYGLAQAGGLEAPTLSLATHRETPSAPPGGNTADGALDTAGSSVTGATTTSGTVAAMMQAPRPGGQGSGGAGPAPSNGSDGDGMWLTLKWTPPSNPRGTTWEVQETGSMSGTGSCFSPTPAPKCTVRRLIPGRIYRFVLMYRLHDWTRASNTVTVPCTASPSNVQPESLTLAAQEATETSTSATTTPFYSTGNAVYLIYAAHTSAPGDSATLSMTPAQPALETATFIGTVEAPEHPGPGVTPSYLWAWYARGTGNETTSAVTVSFAKPTTKTEGPSDSPTGNVLMVMEASGVSENPVAALVTTTFNTSSDSAVLNLNTGSNAQAVFLYVDRSLSPTPPVWSPSSVSNIAGAFQTGPSITGGFSAGGASAAAQTSSATACIDGSTHTPCSSPTTAAAITATANAPATAAGTTAAVLGIAIQLQPATPGTPRDGVPVVTAVSPATGSVRGGTPVTVTGINFGPTSDVQFGNISAATVRVTSSTSLVATAPPGAAGPVDLRVSDHTGASNPSAADVFTYSTVTAPTISGATPATGTTAGGVSVVITGTGFDPTDAVAFGTAPATQVRFTSPTTLTAVSPQHAAGAVEVVVSSLNGASAEGAKDIFTYTTPIESSGRAAEPAGPGGGAVT
jgi:IPT/TIG domain